MLQVALMVVLAIVTASDGVYVFHGDPYSSSQGLPVASSTVNKDQGIPRRTVLFYPTTPGSYVPLLFVPGLFGAIYTELYSTVLERVASHGYIIAGVDLAWPASSSASSSSTLPSSLGDPRQHGGPMPLPAGGVGASGSMVATDMPSSRLRDVDDNVEDVVRKQKEIKAEPQLMFDILQWLVNNLERVLSDHQTWNVSADWSLLGLASHSAGADEMVLMLQSNSSFAGAVAFLEPSSLHFFHPLGYSIPALSYGTQYCTEIPACCIKGMDYFNFYDELVCPRFIMNVTGFGHCDILNDIGWDLCRFSHFCKTVPDTNRALYKTFVTGVLTAFFGTYLQGNESQLQYLTDQSLMPIPLGLLKFDLECAQSMKSPTRH